jgi:hypothetical protein
MGGLCQFWNALFDRNAQNVARARPSSEGGWTLEFPTAMEHETGVRGFFPLGGRVHGGSTTGSEEMSGETPAWCFCSQPRSSASCRVLIICVGAERSSVQGVNVPVQLIRMLVTMIDETSGIV